MKKIYALVALCLAAVVSLASPALAMATKPAPATYKPSRALTDLQALSDEVVRSYDAEQVPAAKAPYDLIQYAIKAAAYADQTGDKATFDRQAATVRKSHDQACAVLAGC